MIADETSCSGQHNDDKNAACHLRRQHQGKCAVAHTNHNVKTKSKNIERKAKSAARPRDGENARATRGASVNARDSNVHKSNTRVLVHAETAA